LQDRLKFAACLETSARIAAKGGAHENALRFATVAESLWELEGTPPFPWLKKQLDLDIAAARDSLTEEEVERAVASAHAMALDKALSEAATPLALLGQTDGVPFATANPNVNNLGRPSVDRQTISGR